MSHDHSPAENVLISGLNDHRCEWFLPILGFGVPSRSRLTSINRPQGPRRDRKLWQSKTIPDSPRLRRHLASTLARQKYLDLEGLFEEISRSIFGREQLLTRLDDLASLD
jgi:hypothetical protein